MWRTWDWAGWLQPQIDDAAKIGNAVRFFGNTHCIAIGTVTRATYMAHWRQVLDYCASQKLDRVVFRTRATNEPMKAVLARVGFVPTQIFYERQITEKG